MNRIVLDTETANTLEQPLCYDIGWAVVDENCEVLKAESYAVAEIFLDKELMSVALFADKIPQYWDEIKTKFGNDFTIDDAATAYTSKFGKSFWRRLLNRIKKILLKKKIEKEQL